MRTMFIDNKYYRIYKSLCERGQTVRDLSGTEVHHITPRSLGGNNSKYNLTTLTYREHYVAHRCLPYCLENSMDRRKMWGAVWSFNTKNRDRRLITSHAYAVAKRQVIEHKRALFQDAEWAAEYRRAILHSHIKRKYNGIRHRNKGIYRPRVSCVVCRKETDVNHFDRHYGKHTDSMYTTNPIRIGTARTCCTVCRIELSVGSQNTHYRKLHPEVYNNSPYTRSGLPRTVSAQRGRAGPPVSCVQCGFETTTLGLDIHYTNSHKQ